MRDTRRWWGIPLALLAAVGVTGALEASAPRPARADAGHCVPAAGLGDFHFTDGQWLRTFTILSGMPDVFLPTDVVESINPSNTRSRTVFSGGTAKMVAVHTTLELSETAAKVLSDTLTRTAGKRFFRQTVVSVTTKVGANTTLQIPPQGRAQLDYGVRVINLTFTMAVYDASSCTYLGSTPTQSGVVPTIVQGFGNGRYWPNISRGENAANAKADIIPGSVVAIIGQYFSPSGLAGTVAVVQNGVTYTLGAGTPHWSYTEKKITITLPKELRPGHALILIHSAEGRQSNPRLITIKAAPVVANAHKTKQPPPTRPR